MLNILQLSADFQYQKLYPNLVRSLSLNNIKQIVYLQCRDDQPYTQLDQISNVNVVNTLKYKTWMKFLYKKRIKTIFSDIERNVDVSSIDLTMAYFLFSDGAIANDLYKKYAIPFIVAIRNSDINHYFKYRFWLKPYIKNVLKNASVIVFPSPAYINILKEIVGNHFFESVILNKIEIIGNIIDEKWFNNPVVKNYDNSSLHLLYAGEFSKNKRIDSIIYAFKVLKEKYNLKLYLIGNYGDDVIRIRKIVKYDPDIIVIDKISDTSKLIAHFDHCHIFLMPSKTETFGNVYVEAMARGLPIIYTKGQGIDGYFNDGVVGFSVSDPIEGNIMLAIEKIIENYSFISSQAIRNSSQFSSASIVSKYISIFNRVVLK